MSDRDRARRNVRGGNSRPATNWKGWAYVVLIILLLIVVIQNSQTVDFNLLFINTSAPLILLLVGAAVVGALIGYLTPIVRRDRHK
jgi:uncharacterized integral membrane protein